jgi:beta-N-acetylhexosaminidase
MQAARRAIRVVGPRPRPLRGALVVELRPRPNVAAGEPGYGVGDALAERDPATTVIALREGEPLPGDGRGRPLVAVARDAARHPWQERALDALARARPDAVVVEVGLPGAARRSGTLILTHGGSRVSCRAVAELLTEGATDG